MTINTDKKLILIVLDGAGIGALPDAALYGDAGSHTLSHVLARRPKLQNLWRLGLANIDGSALEGPVNMPVACYGRMRERSPGKDTTTGHWEICGVVLDHPFPLFPNGFPAEFMQRYEAAIGRGTLGNYPASGTAILNDLGATHITTGEPIIYTSADSVFQIAAHEGICPPDELYRYCTIARKMLAGPLGVGRVIARPFIGTPGAFVRTGNRRDFSLTPPPTLLDAFSAAGFTTYGVGKIEDIFCQRGLSRSNHATGNPACIQAMLEAMKERFTGIIFTNLVDFDMLYGHRNDVKGFYDALAAFDDALPDIIAQMNEQDLLIITADHGCDPTHPGTDHTREYVPLIVYNKTFPCGKNLGTRNTFADIAATSLAFFGIPQKKALAGRSMLPLIQ